jgi:hypothetical protein
VGQGLLSSAAARRAATAGVALLPLAACTAHLFSGVHHPDRSRPVVLVETRSGVELGAATEEGILILGRTTTEGPCRVHYFLGRTPTVEDGTIVPFGGVYHRADIDLKHQSAPLLGRDLSPDDPLAVMLHGGSEVERIPVTLAADPRLEGDVLAWPGRPLPAGTPLFELSDPERPRFVGLVTGELLLGESRYLTFAGVDRMREALNVPVAYPRAPRVKYRPDDIAVIK